MRAQRVVASHDSSPSPQMEGYLRAEVASDTLVALSRNHFSMVMYEMQHHLKPLDLADEFVIVTLAKLANGNGRALGSSAPVPAPSGCPRAPSCSLSLSVSVLRPCLCPHPFRFSLFLFSGIPSFHLHGPLSAVKIFPLYLSLTFWSLFLCYSPSSRSLLFPPVAQLFLCLPISLSCFTPSLSRSFPSCP